MFYFLQKRVSHKRWRAFVKAERRRKKRKEIAQYEAIMDEKKLAILMSDPEYRTYIEEQERLEEEALRIEEEEAQKKREEWMVEDSALHALWLKKKKDAEKAVEEQKRKEERLKKEWEESVQEEEKARLKKLEEKEALLREATGGLGSGMTHNPEPPPGYSRKYKEAVTEPCPFFNKTGACRYGASCSREHKYPTSSRTILLANMYSHIGLDGELIDDYDTDLSLEFSESERYNHFRDFYYDVLPEFEKCGRVIQFKVCCNKSPHLKGNVYVQYALVEHAEKAVQKFNGRWYAGKQISCIFIPIEKWKAAICGLHWRHKCPKGNLCNFLHVYRNPGNAFYSIDVDYLQKSSSRSLPNSSGQNSNSLEATISNPPNHSSKSVSSKNNRRSHSPRESRKNLEEPRVRRYSRKRKLSKSSNRHRERSRRRESSRSRSRSRSRGGRNKENKSKKMSFKR